MTEKIYTYVYYGLRIHSEISLQPLPEIAFIQGPDIHIKFGKITRIEEGLEDTVYKPNTIINQRIFYWYVDDIAEFLIVGKEKVIINQADESKLEDIRVFLLDTIMGVLFIKHEKIILHASCVATDTGAYVFCSNASEGKSTLAANLARKGFSFVEDNRCLLTWNNDLNSFSVINQDPIASLWSNNLAFENFKGVDKIGPVRKNIEKIDYNLSSLVPTEVKSVKKIFIIDMNKSDKGFVHKKIFGIDKFDLLLSYVNFNYLIKDLGKDEQYFKKVMSLARAIPVELISRSEMTPISEFVTYISNEIV